MFKKTISNRIYEDLVKQIEQAIFEGKLKAGDKLPPQRELCDQFETSRGTVREALRVLEQKSLIEIKLGVNGGAIVKSPNAKPVGESLSLLIRQQKISLDELMEFREGVECNVAELASMKITTKWQVVLQDLLEKAASQTKKGTSKWLELINTDREIHIVISKMTNNILYQTILETVQENIMTFYADNPIKTKSVMKENYQELVNIVTAVCSGDPKKSKIHTITHIRRFHAYMQKNK